MPEMLLTDAGVWTFFLCCGLAVALSIGVWSFFHIRTWYREGDDLADDEWQFLSSMRDLKLQGDVSDQEFRSIQGEALRRMKDLPHTQTDQAELLAEMEQDEVPDSTENKEQA